MTDQLTDNIIREAKRIEEDTDYSLKGHYNSADHWSHWHLWIGLPAAILAAIAGGSAFNGQDLLAGSLALLSTAFATVMTFLNPSERAEQHKAAAGAYHELHNKARIFREIEAIEQQEPKAIKEKLIELDEFRNNLNRTSPGIPRWAYVLAEKDISEGRSQHRIDKETS